jgi:hypothetical protein
VGHRLPAGRRILLAEQPARFRLVHDGAAGEVRADLSDVYVAGEGGLMGLVIHHLAERVVVRSFERERIAQGLIPALVCGWIAPRTFTC